MTESNKPATHICESCGAQFRPPSGLFHEHTICSDCYAALTSPPILNNDEETNKPKGKVATCVRNLFILATIAFAITFFTKMEGFHKILIMICWTILFMIDSSLKRKWIKSKSATQDKIVDKE